MYQTINKKCRQIVQDVAWDNYLLVPKYTMVGYSVMMKEIVDQLDNDKITNAGWRNGRQ